MSNGGRQFPYFSLAHKRISQLQVLGRPAWFCFAQTVIRFSRGEGRRQQLSRPVSVRLDTGAFMSSLPQEWLAERDLAPFLPMTSRSLSFQTVSGQGQGTLAG